jgi:hypothetical protein
MALGSAQPLTEIRTRNLLGGKGRPVRMADLTAICEPMSRKCGSLDVSRPYGGFTACYRDTFTFYLSSGT